MSMRFLQITRYLLVSVGLLVSAYLTWIKLANQTAFCAGIGQCDVVNSSQYAEVFGIPIALLGIGSYLALLILYLLENRSIYWQENSPIFVFGITLIGVLYSAYLTYIELAVIHAVCPYCVVSAVVMLSLFSLSIFKLRQQLAEN